MPVTNHLDRFVSTRTGTSALLETTSIFTKNPGRQAIFGLASDPRFGRARILSEQCTHVQTFLPSAFESKAVALTTTFSPTRMTFRFLAGPQSLPIPRQVGNCEILAFSTALPSAMCFSTTMPSKGVDFITIETPRVSGTGTQRNQLLLAVSNRRFRLPLKFVGLAGSLLRRRDFFFPEFSSHAHRSIWRAKRFCAARSSWRCSEGQRWRSPPEPDRV